MNIIKYVFILAFFSQTVFCQDTQSIDKLFYYKFKELKNIKPFFKKKYNVLDNIEELKLIKEVSIQLEDYSKIDTFQYANKALDKRLTIISFYNYKERKQYVSFFIGSK